MNLSANSVFHFTGNMKSLKGILKENFKVKYCTETVFNRRRKFVSFVPMVSFCDIPLSYVSEHISKYGGYGIGLSKSWAKRKGLNPVLYMEKHSDLFNNRDVEINMLNEQSVLQEYLRYTKNYEGPLIRGGGDRVEINTYRFYDEKEWRYSPSKEKIFTKKMYLLSKDNKSLDSVRINEPRQKKNVFLSDDVKNYKDYLNRNLNTPNLEFGADDIKYIIVSGEGQGVGQDIEKTEILNIIEYINSLDYSGEEKKILASKVITALKIKTDM